MTSQVQCAHGGFALLITKNTRVFVDGAPALLETDVHPVLGCPFTVGTKYSPCVRIEWSAGAQDVEVNGTPVLLKSSVGKCIGVEGATQGLAVIGSTQTKVTAR
jgi:hypothetical protein